MGRNRIRRGYSLEVIFEEDTDFCSHLDSLDSVAIRFGVKDREKEDTISVDSLVEEYQIRFQDKGEKDHVFRSLDGIWDVRNMDTCFVEWDEFSPESSLIPKMPPAGGVRSEFNPRKDIAESDAEITSNSGRRSRVSRRQIVEASWVFDSTNSDDNENDADKVEIEKPIGPRLINRQEEVEPKFKLKLDPDLTRGKNPPAIFNLTNKDANKEAHPFFLEKDNLDSYMSTKTDETETNAYTFADSSDPFDNASVASTAYDSSSSTTSTCSNSSTGSVRTVSKIKRTSPALEIPPMQLEIQPEESENLMTVKKVRAMFESQNQQSNQRMYCKNPSPSSPTHHSPSGVHKRLRQSLSSSANNGMTVNKILRSAYSQFNLNENKGLDFADLLVNDRVVIEEKFESRSNRHKTGFAFAPLRRSHSMGTGLAAIEASSHSSKTCILAEELPPPDTVKNVRTVFEDLLRSKSAANPESQLSIIKKSLFSIKCNPSSKIYRSESLRDTFPSSLSLATATLPRRFGKPVLLEKDKEKANQNAANKEKLRIPLQRQTSEPPVKEDHYEEDPHSSENDDFSDDSSNPPKFISSDVLQRIRSCGESTTYFGGRVISKSSRRVLPPSRRHTLLEFPQDLLFSGSSSRSTTPQEYFTPAETPELFLDNERNRILVPRPEKLLPRRVSPEVDEDIFTLGEKEIDSTPRIISVLPKSPSISPTKSGSPVGSVIEGRSTPEGCETIQAGQDRNNNEVNVSVKISKFFAAAEAEGINIINNLIGKTEQKVAVEEGAWF